LPYDYCFQCINEHAADEARCGFQLAASCKQLTAVGGEQNSVGRVAGWAVHFDRLLSDTSGCATFAVSVNCHRSFISKHGLTLLLSVCVFRWCHLVNAYGVISLVRLSSLAPSCGSFLPVLNPVVVIPGLRAGTCAVLRGSLLIVYV